MLEGIELLLLELEGFEHGAVAVQVVQVTAHKVVPAAFEQVFAYCLGATPVVTTERQEVELEGITFFLELAVVGLFHVHVAFGVGQDGLVSVPVGAEQEVVHAHRGVHVGGLDQQVVFAQWEYLAGQAGFEAGIEHVLGRQGELERALVGLLQFLELGFQAGVVVAELFHDMGGEPHFLYSEFFQPGQQTEAGFYIGGAIVYPR